MFRDRFRSLMDFIEEGSCSNVLGSYGTDPAHSVVLGVRHADRQGIKALEIVDGARDRYACLTARMSVDEEVIKVSKPTRRREYTMEIRNTTAQHSSAGIRCRHA